MLIHKSGNVILNLRDPARVMDVIPTAKHLPHGDVTLVVVPHAEDETRVLRNLGFDVPAPIESKYGWPCAYPGGPFIHQRTTSAFLTLNPWSYCLNGMGSGKTLSGLWAYDYLRERQLARRMLVVAPLSTLERTWGDEIFTHFPHLSAAVLHGSMDRRLKLLAVPHNIYITNHDGLKSAVFLEALVARDDIDVVVLDELAVFRTQGTARFKAANRLVKQRKYVWGFTGTPTPNAPTDAWAQCRLVTPHSVPKHFGAFRDQVMRQVSQYKWIARDDALENVRKAMQPAIRFSREECIDLPPTTHQTRHVPLTPEQARAFNDMLKKLKAEYEGGQVLAVNEAVKLGKLVQICCLTGATLTLTDRGWVPLIEVSILDWVWDGVEWVRHSGVVFRGRRKTIQRGGVRMTPDHLVLTDSGWVEAERIRDANASCGLDWAEVRQPGSDPESRQYSGRDQVRDVAVSVRLRERGCAGQSVVADEQPAERAQLRLPARCLERNARHGQHSPVQNVDEYAPQMHGPRGQGLGRVRRAWGYCMRQVGDFVLRILERRSRGVRPSTYLGPQEQRWAVLKGELPVGDTRAARAQQAEHGVSGHSQRPDVCGRGGRDVQDSPCNAVRAAQPIRVVGGQGADDPGENVYDLALCGPLSRFTVRGPGQRPMLVHNCGVVYGQNGQELVLPCGPRIEVVREIIEEAEAKVIVFVPYTSALLHLANALREHFSVELVYGDVSKNERDRIFADFQKRKDPRVLVADARTMSHGLNLTAASTIVWFGPTTSNETYLQANERIPRPGQKLNTLIVHLESTHVEQKMYDRLRKRGSIQGALLEMLRGEK